jgi:hypothetical protein
MGTFWFFDVPIFSVAGKMRNVRIRALIYTGRASTQWLNGKPG